MIQRVERASVRVGEEVVGSIGVGLVVLLGVGREDGAEQARSLAQRILGLRLFDDDAGRMNLALADVRGELLVVSQFTLWGDCRGGRRPSWSRAAPAPEAEALYREFLAAARSLGARVAEGRFRAHMHLDLVNDGPVTILIDSQGTF